MRVQVVGVRHVGVLMPGRRVLVPLASAQWYVTSVVLAAAAWSVAFGIDLVVFTPWLMRSRIDGKDG